MALNTEAIWSALYARLKDGCPSFVPTSITRRRVVPNAPEAHPVLLCLDDNGDETVISDPDAPEPVWRLTGELVVMAWPAEGDEGFSSALNTLVTEVQTALERQPADPLGTGEFYGRGHVQHYTNLGGLVRVLSVTKVEKGRGEAGNQAVAKLSIEMEAR